tara:strand:+ start:151 stop:327 length:177 start_codon:yes stop_codon:yes gene_type:complete
MLTQYSKIDNETQSSKKTANINFDFEQMIKANQEGDEDVVDQQYLKLKSKIGIPLVNN